MKRRWKIRNPQFRAFLYLLPALSVIAVFQFYPVLKSFFMGFYTKFDYLTDTVEAVGLDNFLYVLKDPEFALAMKNTAVFAVISVPVSYTHLPEKLRRLYDIHFKEDNRTFVLLLDYALSLIHI